MLNLLEQAIITDNSEFAAKIIQDARGIESDDDLAYARLPQPRLSRSCPDFSATFTTVAFDDSSLRWLEIST